jgi:hypothetical protein
VRSHAPCASHCTAASNAAQSGNTIISCSFKNASRLHGVALARQPNRPILRAHVGFDHENHIYSN